MARVTFANVNEALHPLDVEVVMGRGYFYFAALKGSPIGTHIAPSVYTTRLTDLTIDDWVEAAKTYEI